MEDKILENNLETNTEIEEKEIVEEDLSFEAVDGEVDDILLKMALFDEDASEENVEEGLKPTKSEQSSEVVEENIESDTSLTVEENIDKSAEITSEENVEEANDKEELTDDDNEEDEESDAEEELEEEKDNKKQAFKLTLPENFSELEAQMCTKRGRKLIYKPNEVIYENSFVVLGTDKKNDEGIRVKDIIDAEIKEGLKLGYLEKFDGLKTSEIKEEYEDDVVYELAEQEFRKMGVIYNSKDVLVYLYDWDRKGFHNVGKIDLTDAGDLISYLEDKENYSFDICGIITGGKAKRVTKDEKGKIKIIKEKGDPIGIDLDITIVKRKD